MTNSSHTDFYLQNLNTKHDESIVYQRKSPQERQHSQTVAAGYLLQRAIEGAEVEMVNLYDHKLNIKGCMSCFACKVKGGKKGVCSFKDDLLPILQKAVEADVLVCGSPNYCGYPTALLRAFMERIIFPTVNYSDYSKPTVLKKIHTATIYTMNCPNDEFYHKMNYQYLMDTNANELGVFGPTEILRSYDTYQFKTTAATMPL